MSEIRVHPDALTATGSALSRIGDALASIAVEVAAVAGAGDAANQPDVAAAVDRAVSVWKQELKLLAHGVTAAARATRSAGEAYTTVDRNAVPSGPRTGR